MRNKTLVEHSLKSAVHSPQSKNKDSGLGTQDSGLAALPSGPRSQFLAANPRKREVWEVFVDKFKELVAQYRGEAKSAGQKLVDTAELGRQIGLLILEMENELPGKRLTEDFWQQHPELHFDLNGQSIARERLEWFVATARRYPDKIKMEDVGKIARTVQLALGGEEFVLAAERAPQVSHAPESPVSLLRERLNFQRIEEVWRAVRADHHFCPDGRLRADLRDALRVELGPTIKIVDELKRELEL